VLFLLLLRLLTLLYLVNAVYIFLFLKKGDLENWGDFGELGRGFWRTGGGNLENGGGDFGEPSVLIYRGGFAARGRFKMGGRILLLGLGLLP